jgi:hypothetical protein
VDAIQQRKFYNPIIVNIMTRYAKKCVRVFVLIHTSLFIHTKVAAATFGPKSFFTDIHMSDITVIGKWYAEWIFSGCKIPLVKLKTHIIYYAEGLEVRGYHFGDDSCNCMFPFIIWPNSFSFLIKREACIVWSTLVFLQPLYYAFSYELGWYF